MKRSQFLAAMAIDINLAGVLAAASADVHAQNVGSGQLAVPSPSWVTPVVPGTSRSKVRGYAAQTLKDSTEMVNRVKFIKEANVNAPMPTGPNNTQ